MKEIIVRSVSETLKLNLSIPNYQRPYCWSKKSVHDLLNDIQNTSKQYDKNKQYKYRIGTVILYNEGNKKQVYEIVDGQQRIITLSLIKYVFDNDYKNYLLDNFKFSDKKTIYNIQENEKVIKQWYESIPNKKHIKKILDNKVEFLVVTVNDIDEAFQLFDSQNSSGKELYPHDLLKAFHLREMDETDEKNILEKVKKWENEDSKNIAALFEYYLYPIKCWASKEDAHKFSNDDIDKYKGITNNIINTYKYYNYYKVFKSDIFQINMPFYSGNDFFEMVTYYLDKITELVTKVKELDKNIYMLLKTYLFKNNNSLKDCEYTYLKETINSKSLGMKYNCQLFFAVLLFYYDRFNEIDNLVLNKLFIWAFMLRIDLEMVNMKSINIYALGYENGRTTNHIPIFYLIANFKNHFELYDIAIETKPNENNWQDLYNYIEILENNKEEEDYE